MEPPASEQFLSDDSLASVQAVRTRKVVKPTPRADANEGSLEHLTVLDESMIDPGATTSPNESSVASVSFRSLEECTYEEYNDSYNTTRNPTSFQRQRDITFSSEGSPSRLSAVSVYESTLPMAFDNERFFDPEEGYANRLKQAADKIDAAISNNAGWMEGNQEATFLGRIWRSVLVFFLLRTCDAINRFGLTRGMLDYLNFLGAYESFVLGGVIRYFDIPKSLRDPYSLYLAMKNRNVCRILVLQVAHRWAWFFHVHQQLRWRRMFDFLGWLPWFGHYAALPSENYPSSRWYPLWNLWDTFLELFRWHNDDVHNLTPELTGFEEAVRNHFGCHNGRTEFNKFRFEHRLTIDESIVRSFVANPTLTLLNNGVEHVLICVSKHWQSLLLEENGNFAHQRMELLNPFEALRYQLPGVLIVLANLRGRCNWDSEVLAPLVHRLQALDPSRFYKTGRSNRDLESQPEVMILGPCQAGKRLVQEILGRVVADVCAAIPSRMDPLNAWLNAIAHSFDVLQKESEEVSQFVTTVKTGVKLGYSLLKIVDWRVPPDNEMKQAIERKIRFGSGGNDRIPDTTIAMALRKLSPKDERTLRELIEKDLRRLPAAQRLLARTSVLLIRELHRHQLDLRLRRVSEGDPVDVNLLEKTTWYWVDSGHGYELCMFSRNLGTHLKFLQIETNSHVLYEADKIHCLEYLPVAESITRAQKAYMTIETDHCKKFSYTTFMEFGSGFSSNSLKTMLRRLLTVSQICCSELDQARLRSLTEIRSSVAKRNKLSASRLVPHCRPQNTVVIGGGPTGLLCAMHCLQNVLLTGGNVRVYEGRDAYSQQAASFERAQIVRLDARQISMLRYHLGSGFEDVFVPMRGESQPHLGNAIPEQQFIEVVIKRLESMLLDEVINLRSKNLLEFYSDSMVQFDAESCVFRKVGRALKPGDVIFDETTGEDMQIDDFIFEATLGPAELRKGFDYDICLPNENEPRSFRLEKVDEESDWYAFVERVSGPEIRDPVILQGNFEDLPPAYRTGYGRAEPTSVTIIRNGLQEERRFDTLCDKLYQLRLHGSHVVVALGKPRRSSKHLKVTAAEPYSVCCLEGLKVSDQMHQFGVTRFGKGIWDDYFEFKGRHNARILGDFRKSIRISAIIERMAKKLSGERHWQRKTNFPKEDPEQASTISKHLVELSMKSLRRERLQCRLFELGNNVYLGMELPREFGGLKSNMKSDFLIRLWYEAAFETISKGHAIRRRERRVLPRFRLRDFSFLQHLSKLHPHDGFGFGTELLFRLVCFSSDGSVAVECLNADGRGGLMRISAQVRVQPQQTSRSCALGLLRVNDEFSIVDFFEIVEKRARFVIVRSSTGHISLFPSSFPVIASSDLAKGPTGYAESKVAVASFDLAHYVSHRTLRVNPCSTPGDSEFVTVLIGDAQASPHFMRYSGLTGACINCATFNSLVGLSLADVQFSQRIQQYAFETNWSNREVVRRGTGANFGFDAFLRPGFSYDELIDYLYDKSLEAIELGIQIEPLLSRDWQLLLSAALVPRGMETENDFFEAVVKKITVALEAKFLSMISSKFSNLNETHRKCVSYYVSKLTAKWTAARGSAHAGFVLKQLSSYERDTLSSLASELKPTAEALISCLHRAVESKLLNQRHPAEVFQQPNALDARAHFDYHYLSDSFGRKFGFWVCLTAFGHVRFLEEKRSFAVLLTALNLFLAANLLGDPVRIRNRARYARAEFSSKLTAVRKAVFLLFGHESVPPCIDPFVEAVDRSVLEFYEVCQYYGMESCDFMDRAYKRFTNSPKTESIIVEFMKQISSEFMLTQCSGNGYIQDQLVRVYLELNDLLQQRRQPSHDEPSQEAMYLMTSLDKIEANLLQNIEGKSHWAFCMQGYALTRQMLHRLRRLPVRACNERIKRSIDQLDQLHIALKYCRIAGIMALTGFLVVSSTAFSLGSLLASTEGGDSPFPLFVFFFLLSAIGTIAITYSFGFNVSNLFSLYRTFWEFREREFHHLRILIGLKLLATVLFIGGCLAGLGSLSWHMAAKSSDSGGEEIVSFYGYLSTSSLVLHLFSVFLHMHIHYQMEYSMSPHMAKSICDALQQKIHNIKRKYPDPTANELFAAERARESWDIVAACFVQKYGFDSLFDRDRCFALVQYIRSKR